MRDFVNATLTGICNRDGFSITAVYCQLTDLRAEVCEKTQRQGARVHTSIGALIMENMQILQDIGLT